MAESLLTVDEVARELRVHPHTVRMLLRTGRLPGMRIGVGSRNSAWRVRRADVEAWMEERLVGRR